MRALMLGDDLAGAGGLCRRRGRQGHGTFGRASHRAGRGRPGAPVWSPALLHILIAMSHHHRWSHEAAVLETARQTAAVYGLAWGGGVYVNYLFVGVWLAELVWWRIDPAALSRPARLERLGGASLLPGDRLQCRRDLRGARATRSRCRRRRGAGAGVVTGGQETRRLNRRPEDRENPLTGFLIS